MRKIYKFYWDFGSQGEVSGIFISDDKTIKENLGKIVSFGDCLGKHSDISGELNQEDIEEISEDQDFINKFEAIIGKSFGHNPLTNINE